MLSFQLASFLLNALPPVVWLIEGFYKVMMKLIRGPTAADRFADVVKAAMKQDPNILARKYADKWMVKVLGRGLLRRQLMHFEKPTQALPFNAAASVRALGRGVTITRDQIKKIRVLKRSNMNIGRRDVDDLVPVPSELLEDGINIDAAGSGGVTAVLGGDDGDSSTLPREDVSICPAAVHQNSNDPIAFTKQEEPELHKSVSIEILVEESNAADVLEGAKISDEGEEEEVSEEDRKIRKETSRSVTLSGRELGDRIAAFEVPRSRPVLPISRQRQQENSGSSSGAANDDVSQSGRITTGAWRRPSSPRTQDEEDHYQYEDESASKPKRIWWRP
jgi:hypothetical protein